MTEKEGIELIILIVTELNDYFTHINYRPEQLVQRIADIIGLYIIKEEE